MGTINRTAVAINFRINKSKRGRPKTGDYEQITRELTRHYKEMIRLMPKNSADWAKLSTAKLLASYYLLLRLAMSEKRLYHKVKWTNNPQAKVLAEAVKPIVVKRIQTILAVMMKSLLFAAFGRVFKGIAKKDIDPTKLQRFLDALAVLYSVNPVDVNTFLDNGGQMFARAIAQKWSTIVKSKRTRVLLQLAKKYGVSPDPDDFRFTIKTIKKLGAAYKRILSAEDVRGLLKIADDIMKFAAAGGLDGVLKVASGVSDLIRAMAFFTKRPSIKKYYKYIPDKLKKWLKVFSLFLDVLVSTDQRVSRSKPRKVKPVKIKKWSNPEQFLEELYRE